MLTLQSETTEHMGLATILWYVLVLECFEVNILRLDNELLEATF